MDTKDKASETSVTSFTHLRGLLSIASLSSRVRLIELSRCLFSLRREASTRFLTDVLFFSRQSTLFPFPPSSHRLISIPAKSCRQSHPRDSAVACSCSSRIKSGKVFLPAETNQSRTPTALNGYDFFEVFIRKCR